MIILIIWFENRGLKIGDISLCFAWHCVESHSLHCVVADSKPSCSFMSGWLCLCQVQVGSGCRCPDINTTAMKANTVTDWLKQSLWHGEWWNLCLLKGELHWFSRRSWVSGAISVNRSTPTELSLERKRSNQSLFWDVCRRQVWLHYLLCWMTYFDMKSCLF